MSDLTKTEQDHVRTALRYLRQRLGTWSLIATTLKIRPSTLCNAIDGRKPISPTVAFRTARFAQVSIDDLLAGKYPDPRACPHCGQVPPSPD